MAKGTTQQTAGDRRPSPRAATRESTGLNIPDLFAELRTLLGQIPAGRVTTYGRLAAALGDVSAARWVASCLLDPGGPADLPCHRVVLRDGALGKHFAGSADEKARRLNADGIGLTDLGVDLKRYEFNEFKCAQPLVEPIFHAHALSRAAARKLR